MIVYDSDLHCLRNFRCNDFFNLRVPKKYTMYRIMPDEHHLIAISLVGNKSLTSIFDLVTCNESDGDKSKGRKTARKFFRAERHIGLALDGWLVVPFKDKNTFAWFNKNGERSETITDVDLGNLQAIYSSRSSLLFAL